MESSDLNTPRSEDAELESWLRERSPTTALPDDGFTNRVLAALPAAGTEAVSARAALSRWRMRSCLAGALAGTAVFWLGTAPSTGAGIDLNQLLKDVGHAAMATSALLGDPLLAFALVATAGSLIVAYWREVTP